MPHTPGFGSPFLPQEPVALIADIHGNLTALEAVLDDIRRRGLRQIVVMGDLAGKGPRGAAVVDIVRDLGCPVLLGNWDELLARPVAANEAIRWWREELGPERTAYLGGLPYALDLPRAAGLVRLYHSSAKGVWHRVYLSSPIEELAALFLPSEAVGLEAPVPAAVGYADIHTAYAAHLRRRELPPEFEGLRGRLVFNTGSVGNPLDQPVPSYAMLGGGAGLELTLVRVPYDIEAECRAAEASGMPYLEEYLEETRFARYRTRW